MPKYVINPVNSGNQPLSVEVLFEGSRVAFAKVGIMGFWNYDMLLSEKHPLDALQIALRLNSHLSVAHGVAAARAIESAGGLPLSFNGLLARKMLLACEYVYYHLYHFYQGVLFTFTSGPKGEALPTQDRIPPGVNKKLVENYWQAIAIRTRLQELMAILSGKVPHNGAIVPGGTSESIDARKLVRISSQLKQGIRFLQENYLKDIQTLVQFYPEWSRDSVGKENYLVAAEFPEKLLETGKEDNYHLASGAVINGVPQKAAFEKVDLDYTCSWMLKDGSYDIDKVGAYSWIGAGQYEGNTVETGALARYKINRYKDITETVKVESVLGREMVRVNEAIYFCKQVVNWLNYVEPGQPMKAGELIVPEEGNGIGVAESPAGPVVHRVKYDRGVIKEYFVIDPCVFNLAPHSTTGEPGPAEQALTGLLVADPLYPIEIVRVLRSLE